MKNKSKLLYDGIILLGIAMVCYAGVRIYGHYADRAASNSLYEELNEQYVSKTRQISTHVEETVSLPEGEDQGSSVSGGNALADVAPVIEETPWHDMIRVDFESLRERNQDVVGWIFFENEDISYPILYSEDSAKYLYRTLDGKSASAGSIFLDGNNTPDFEDSRNVIYGHNMKNLSMFGNLKYYIQEKDYYEDHQYFQILTEGIVYRYRIFSCFDVPETETEICRVDFATEKDFSDFTAVLRKRSVIDTEIEVDCDDKVVTLLTCYVTGRRTLINAVRVDSYEIDTGTQEELE
ncbi:MAG: class B sortase [Acetatifactor sp.]|nr:class B sortase [Acetatifactor sp.]